MKHTPMLTFDEKIKDIQQEFDIIGCAVLALTPTITLISQGYGWTRPDRVTPVDRDTKFRVASLSKPVTATAVMQLYEQGRISLDEDVSSYLGYEFRNPNFPGTPITITQLLTHTSGLRDGEQYDAFLTQTTQSAAPDAIRDILVPGGKYASEDTWSSTFAPGDPAGWSYCNLASGVLATILEQVTGEYFSSYCRQHIFDPLGMSCSYLAQELPASSTLATLHRYDQSTGEPYATCDNGASAKRHQIPYQNFPPGYNGSLYGPQGGLRASLADLEQFVRMHMNGGTAQGCRILSPETVALMHRVHWTGRGDHGRYRQKGLQFHITDNLLPGQTLIGHGGDAYGLIADLYFNQSYDFGLVFLSNGGRFQLTERGFYDIEERVVKTVYHDIRTRI